MPRRLIDLRTAELHFDRGPTPIGKDDHRIGFKSRFIAIVEYFAVVVFRVHPKVVNAQGFELEAEGLHVLQQRRGVARMSATPIDGSEK